jgi:hypothetical protein
VEEHVSCENSNCAGKKYPKTKKERILRKKNNNEVVFGTRCFCHLFYPVSATKSRVILCPQTTVFLFQLLLLFYFIPQVYFQVKI